MIKLKKLLEDKNIKTISVFITPKDYIRYNKKTPLYLDLLSRADNIKSGEWTDYFKVNHTLLGKIQRLFKVMIQEINEISDEAFGSPLAYWRNILQLLVYNPDRFEDIVNKWIPLAHRKKMPDKSELKKIRQKFKRLSSDKTNKHLVTMMDELIRRL